MAKQTDKTKPETEEIGKPLEGQDQENQGAGQDSEDSKKQPAKNPKALAKVEGDWVCTKWMKLGGKRYAKHSVIPNKEITVGMIEEKLVMKKTW